MTGLAIQKIDLASFLVYGFGMRQSECHSIDEWPEGILTVETIAMAHSRARRAFVPVACTLTLRRSVVSDAQGVRFRLRMDAGWQQQLPPRLYPGPPSLTWQPIGMLVSGSPVDQLERANELNAQVEIDGVRRVVACGKISSMTIR